MSVPFLVLAVLFLAYSNGANDNFKGVASLIGNSTTTYRTALAWAMLHARTGAVREVEAVAARMEQAVDDAVVYVAAGAGYFTRPGPSLVTGSRQSTRSGWNGEYSSSR
jgi:phosphate/sulfate permease